LVFVFIGCTRLAGSDYPMDTKFLTLSYRKLKAIKDSYKGAEFDVFSLFQPDQTLLGDPC